MTPAVRWIREESRLREFRGQEFTPAALVAALSPSRGLLLPQDPGVGKSVLLDGLIDLQRREHPWDVLLYLTSQRRALQERPSVQEWEALSPSEQAQHEVAVLYGRPADLCGDLNSRWQVYEKAGCTLAGKHALCLQCPARPRCGWLDQLSRNRLQDKRVIFGTQAMLNVIPPFLELVRSKTRAEKILAALDEGPVLDATLRAFISQADLERSLDVFNRVPQQRASSDLANWVSVHRQLLNRDTVLHTIDRPPLLQDSPARRIQECGLDLFGPDFRYLGFELRHLADSRRWRTDNGIGYVRRPSFRGVSYLIAAAGVPVELARHRLGDQRLRVFCPGVRFLHRGTEVYNIRSSIGAATRFRRNAPQILFAVAHLICKLVAEERRCVVVSKVGFVDDVITLLEKYLHEVGGKEFKVIHNPGPDAIENPMVIPLLHYGAQAINVYQHFHAAIAVNSYNARTDVLRDRLNDLEPPGRQARYEFNNVGGRRLVQVVGYRERQRGLGELARAYQDHLETSWPEQALGRVRFATRPRLVIFFQTGPVRYPLTAEFTSLGGLRHHFGLLTRREWEYQVQVKQVLKMRERGDAIRQIAEVCNVSPRTIYRRLRDAGWRG